MQTHRPILHAGWLGYEHRSLQQFACCDKSMTDWEKLRRPRKPKRKPRLASGK